MYFFTIGPSEKDNKKITVVVYDEKKKKTLHIGQMGYQDYPQHQDEEIKQRYIQRHKKNEDWNDIFTAGFYSRWLLWNKPTLQDSIRDIEKKFNLRFIKNQ